MIARFYKEDGQTAGWMGGSIDRILNDTIPRGGYMIKSVGTNDDGFTVLEYANAAGKRLTAEYDTMLNVTLCEDCYYVANQKLDRVLREDRHDDYEENLVEYGAKISMLRVRRAEGNAHYVDIDTICHHSTCYICERNEIGMRYPAVIEK